MTNSIFFDLDIDSSASLSNPDAFAKLVKEKATFLREQLSRNTSIRISEMTERFRNQATEDGEALIEAEHALQLILDIVGGLSDNGKVHLTTLMPKLSRVINGDIEGTAFNMYRQEYDDEPMDKKTTHKMYIELRRVYNMWVSFQNAFNEGTGKTLYAELPAIPGNFNSTTGGVRKTQIFYSFHVDGMEFLAHTGLQRYLNHKYPSLGLTLVDKKAAIDWAQENTEYKVTVKETRA